jgi:enamine deaminase RidA (YjgF/YER057c/UK114 family)
MSAEARLAELGIELPEPPALTFVPRLKPLVVEGNLGFLSGNGDLGCLGRVGDDVSVEQAAQAARITAHLLCRTLRQELGSLDRVERWVKALVLVRSAPGFSDQPVVANGFSNAIAELWGDENGICARSAIGVAELPGGLAVEIEAIVALKD